MAKLSSLLKLRGTRFSPTRRESAAPEAHSAALQTSKRAGMPKTSARLKRKQDDVESAVASNAIKTNNATKLKSVESLQPGLPSALESGSVSGVYIVKREEHRGDERREKDDPQNEARRTRMMNPLLEHVTLVVYGWHNVEPGTLAWVFPSVGAAVAAARAMTNAVRWAIVAGKRDNGADTDIEDARAHGAVLVESV